MADFTFAIVVPCLAHSTGRDAKHDTEYTSRR